MLALALVTPGVRADDPASSAGVTVRTDRARRDRERVESGPRFATSIDARARGNVVESVADLVDEAPGVQARRTGDGLAPTNLVVRGATGGRLTYALDGVILNDAAGEGVDLSLVPPALLERIDIYRGFAPSRLGVGGLGGAIEFVTRAPGSRPFASVSAGYGSFGQRRIGAAAAGRAGPVRILLSVGYRGTQGDFTFFDDHGSDEQPDREAPTTARINNAADALDVLYRACVGGSGRQGCVLLVHDWRRRGLPGPLYPQYRAPSLASRRLLARGSFRAALGGGFLEPYVAATLREDHYQDPSGMVVPGLVTDTRSGTTGGEAGLIGTLRTGLFRVEPVLRARAEDYFAAGASAGDTHAVRMSALEGLDVSLTAGPTEFTLALAGEGVVDRATGSCSSGGPCRGLPTTARELLSPRLGGRVELRPGLELRANVGHLERAPSLIELFGIGDYLHGNTGLRPEVSDGADAGGVVRFSRGAWSARVEGAAYGRFVRDLISFVPIGFYLAALDVGDARILGLEGSARVSYGNWFAATLSYGFTDARVRAPVGGAYRFRAPGVPEHDVYARAEGTYGYLHAWLDYSFVSEVFFDSANVKTGPAQHLVGAGITANIPWLPGLALTVLGTNLLDQRVGFVPSGSTTIRAAIADYSGYPLPGRAVFAQIGYTVGSTP